MRSHIPAAPEWEAWFRDPEDASLFRSYAVAFWEYWQDQNGIHVSAFCPNFGEPHGAFVGASTENFLYFSWRVIDMDAPKRPPWKQLRYSVGRWGWLDHFMHLFGIRGRLMRLVCDRYDKELGAPVPETEFLAPEQP